MKQHNLGINLDHNSRNIVTSTYGTKELKFKDADKNKALKLTDSNAMVLCEEGDEIEGFVVSLEPALADGLSYGSCVLHAPLTRMYVTGDDLKFGDFVVCGSQTPPGTSNVNLNHPLNQYGTTVVKKGNPVTFKWRVIAKDPRKPNLFLIQAV